MYLAKSNQELAINEKIDIYLKYQNDASDAKNTCDVKIICEVNEMC